MIVGASALIASACGSTSPIPYPTQSTPLPAPTPQPTPRLTPIELDWGKLVFHDYAPDAIKLIDALRPYNPLPRITGGEEIFTLKGQSAPPEFGWFFYRENQFFGTRVQDV